MKFFGHLSTIMQHRRKVIVHTAKCGILWQGLKHDLSKYSPTEFFQSVKYYQGGTRSPNDAAREDIGYSAAWVHHKGRNRHHFEHWTDYDAVTKEITPIKMPLRYVKEMFCDRVAATKVYMKKNYNGSLPLDYYNRGKAKNYMHPETSELLRQLLTMLSEKGEKETFRYIKNLKDY